MKNSDLHTHSYYSDGVLSPSEIVKLASLKGIKTLALTDHNSFGGVDEAIKAGKKYGVSIVPGIELRSKECEVLGYFIDYHNTGFRKKVRDVQARSREVLVHKLNQFKAKGMDARISDVLDTRFKRANPMSIYLLRYLKSKGYGDVKELKSLIEKGDDTEARFSAREIVGIIKDSGGVPVLAHPWYSKPLLERDKLEELVREGLRGIEIDNGGYGPERDEKTVEKIRAFAKKYKLILTSGSDFHGDERAKQNNTHQLGESNCDEKVIKQLKQAI